MGLEQRASDEGGLFFQTAHPFARNFKRAVLKLPFVSSHTQLSEEVLQGIRPYATNKAMFLRKEGNTALEITKYTADHKYLIDGHFPDDSKYQFLFYHTKAIGGLWQDFKMIIRGDGSFKAVIIEKGKEKVLADSRSPDINLQLKDSRLIGALYDFGLFEEMNRE